jgi:hypothetical protein
VSSYHQLIEKCATGNLPGEGVLDEARNGNPGFGFTVMLTYQILQNACSGTMDLVLYMHSLSF